MKNHYSGHSSRQYSYASFILIALLTISSLGSQKSLYAAFTQPVPQSWEVFAELNGQAGPNPPISLELLVSGAEFDGKAFVLAQGTKLHFILTAIGAELLPAATEIAILKIGRVGTPGYQSFLVFSDGGGMIILMDEF